MSELRQVSVFSSFANRLEALVHESVRRDGGPVPRHVAFITSRICVSLAVLGALPLYLALAGAPAISAVLICAFAIAPLFAAVYVSRTGNLLPGHMICVGAIMLLSLVFAAAGGAMAPAAMLLAVLAPLEAAMAGSVVALLASLAGSLALIAALAVFSLTGLSFAIGAGPSVAILAASVAILYSVCLSGAFVYNEICQRRAFGSRQIRYRSLSEVIGDLVLRMDRSGAVERVSENCAELFGLPQSELAGRGFFDRVHVADRPAFLKAVSDAADAKEVVAATLRLRSTTAAGEQQFRWVELRANQIGRNPAEASDSENNERGSDRVIAIVRDVTAIKLHQDELEAARNMADQANVWKDRFLANVSHELRTPLNAIIGFSEILSTESIAPSEPEKCREYALIIKESGEHLLSVVNSILDISKIEAGSFDIVPEEFEVAALIDTCVGMLHLRAAKSEINLACEIDPKVHGVVADKRAFKQIVINLLSNAIKFTPARGDVEVGLKPEGNSLVLWVRDTGIGIAESELDKIGDPFFQAIASYDRPYEGTGLGLSVVRGLVGLHGGSIQIESGLGAGTCITVKLPLDCRHANVKPAPMASIEAIPLPPAKAGRADFSLDRAEGVADSGKSPIQGEVQKVA